MALGFLKVLHPVPEVKAEDGKTTWAESGAHPALADDQSMQKRAADRVAHLSPVAAEAQLMSEGIGGADLPSKEQIKKARRKQLAGRGTPGLPVRQPQDATGHAWLETIYRFIHSAGWLPLDALRQEPWRTAVS